MDSFPGLGAVDLAFVAEIAAEPIAAELDLLEGEDEAAVDLRVAPASPAVLA